MKKASFLPLAAILIVSAQAQTPSIQVDKNNRTIAITASDTASAPADIASISVGFGTWAPDADSAYRQGSKISNAIVAALKKADVPDEAIQSRGQNLSRTVFLPDNPTTPEERARRQFTLSQSWSVRTSARDAAAVLHAAIEAGANESGNIDWDVADRSALQAKAAAKALARAHAIAAQMAAGLGVQLGPLLYASNQMPQPPIRPLLAIGRMSKAATASAPLAIFPQRVEESATVYAVFSIQ